MNSVTKLVKLIGNGAIFVAPAVSNNVDLSNYQNAKVVVRTGEGTAVTTKLFINVIGADNNEHCVHEQEITIGAETDTEVLVSAQSLAKYDATEFNVAINPIADCEITGEVDAILTDARYSE